jgi:hypothetical protein
MTLMQKIKKGTQPAPRRLLLYGTQGIGKAQPLDAGVLTPTGFKSMGDIEVGDQVVGRDGKSCNVIGVYPQGKKQVYRVTFRDGSSTECCDEHLWFTTTFNERKKHAGAVRTLKYIRESLRYGTHFNHAVPRVRPVEFEAKPQPIEPWLLGMWLGDGYCSGNAAITNSEKDIQQRIERMVASMGDAITRQTDNHLRIKSSNRTRSNFKKLLEQLELDQCGSADKFVPDVYLHGSVEQRLEVLRGLIDSDGFVTQPGAVEYTTVSPRLADDFCFLVRSLGGSACVKEKQGRYKKDGVIHKCKKVYRIFASFAGVVPVSSEKHLSKWQIPQWRIHHTIRTVEPVGEKQCQCIRVDAADQLYVTDDFVVTHNSTFAAASQSTIFIQTEDGLGEIICDKFPLAESFNDVMTALRELYTQKHPYTTVAVDSLDWLERLIWADICTERSVSNIEDIGYAKGYVFALDKWRNFLDGLTALRRDKGFTIILIAHAKIEKFENPETESYDRYVPRLHKLASALIQEWCDEVLFATYKVHTKQTDEGFGRKGTRGIGNGERILRTVERPSHMAKNRLNLPDELPLDWNAYAQHFTHNQKGVPANG